MIDDGVELTSIAHPMTVPWKQMARERLGSLGFEHLMQGMRHVLLPYRAGEVEYALLTGMNGYGMDAHLINHLQLELFRDEDGHSEAFVLDLENGVAAVFYSEHFQPHRIEVVTKAAFERRYRTVHTVKYKRMSEDLKKYRKAQRKRLAAEKKK